MCCILTSNLQLQVCNDTNLGHPVGPGMVQSVDVVKESCLNMQVSRNDHCRSSLVKFLDDNDTDIPEGPDYFRTMLMMCP